MYFQNRAQAGQMLAQELSNYRYENCVVVALSDGAVAVGEQIAAELHCILTILLTEDIDIPGENTVIGTISQNGGFTYNQMLPAGQIEEYYSEFHGYIEDKKRERYEHMNRLLGDGGLLDEAMLQGHVVILVSDGFKNGASLEAAADFLKPIRVKRLVVATPVASVQAVDRMHILADELHVLSVTDNFLETNHYYDVNDTPTHEEVVAKINQIVLQWR